MVLLVYVHAFNLQPRYLQPMTLVEAPATWDNVMQYLFANGLLRFRIPILFSSQRNSSSTSIRSISCSHAGC